MNTKIKTLAMLALFALVSCDRSMNDSWLNPPSCHKKECKEAEGYIHYRITRPMSDTEMLNWLADRCYYPNDHPCDKICVLVPEQISASGSFTLNTENDRHALRAAIEFQNMKDHNIVGSPWK